MPLPSELTLRPVRPDDLAFLLALYTESHAKDLAAMPLPDAQKAQLIRSQYDMQDAQYRRDYPDADFLIITWHDQPIGRFSKATSAQMVHLIDIALIPQSQGQGIGTTLLRHVLQEADALKLPSELKVLMSNPAIHLYQRLGFEQVDLQAPHIIMQRPARIGGQDQLKSTE